MPKAIKMMFCLLVILLLSGAGTQALNAAEIFNKKEPLQDQAQQNSDEGILELLDEAPAPSTKKKAAPPETINDFANLYYKNCTKQEHPILKGKSLELLCGCTSAQIPQNMSVKQMRDMQENTPEGEHQRSRMLLFVYTPCIQYPTKALVRKQCLDNPEVKAGMKQYKRVCECLADGMAGFMKEEAPRYVEMAMRRNGADLDPLRMLMESTLFEEKSQYYMRKCVTTHEFGITR